MSLAVAAVGGGGTAGDDKETTAVASSGAANQPVTDTTQAGDDTLPNSDQDPEGIIESLLQSQSQ